MIILPVLALGFKMTTWAIAAGLDGRVVHHRHRGGENWTHEVPYSARFWAAMTGKAPAVGDPCPVNDTPIEREYTYWPH